MFEQSYPLVGAILITGTTGLVGRAIAETLLANADNRLLLPVRQAGRSLPYELPTGAAVPEELVIDAATADPIETAARLRDREVRTIVHAAGSCHYTDKRELIAGNQALTAFWLAVGRAAGVARFVYISTAFSGGCRAEVIPETLHADGDGEDLTPYMWSKRETEHLVATSGLPCLILRPSIVIGDSRTGVYRGKLYGLYQHWAAAHRWLTADDAEVVATILGGGGALPMLHLDMFQDVFLAAVKHLPDGAVAHVVSPETDLPRMSDFVELWARSNVVLPPLATARRAEARVRMWTAHTRVNLEISQRRWRFAHAWLDRLTPVRARRPYVSVETLLTCQDWFRRHRLATLETATPETVEPT